jgi:hypothetical protein
VQIDPRAFLAAVTARTRLLPRVKIFVIGDPARAEELRIAMFAHDRYLFDTAGGPDDGLVWSFDGSLGILVDEVPHEQIALASIAALADPQQQLQFASLQKVSDQARHAVVRDLVRDTAGLVGFDPARLLVDALAQIAIAFGMRPDTSDHALSERLKDFGGIVEPTLHHVHAIDRAAFVEICRAFEATCAACARSPHELPLGHFANAVTAALAAN